MYIHIFASIKQYVVRIFKVLYPLNITAEKTALLLFCIANNNTQNVVALALAL